MGYESPVTRKLSGLIEHFDSIICEEDCGGVYECQTCGTLATLENINEVAKGFERKYDDTRKEITRLRSLVKEAYWEASIGHGRDIEISWNKSKAKQELKK